MGAGSFILDVCSLTFCTPTHESEFFSHFRLSSPILDLECVLESGERPKFGCRFVQECRSIFVQS